MAPPNANATPRKAAALAMAILPLFAVGALTLWKLHHPTPTVRAPVAIDRNALLPHRYAGPCLNCHRIVEVGPVAINAGNMQKFRLSPVERQLLLAGQRVDPPDLSQKLSIPAITRTDGLPHPYVGVCCNCHVVLDVHPSPEFMKEAMRRANQPLAGLNLSAELTARGGSVLDESRARYRRGWGYAALPLLVLSVVFIVLRIRARKAGAPQRDPWLGLHEAAAAAFCAAALLHWSYSDRGNNFLHLALVSLAWLAAGGAFLRYRLARRPAGAPSSISKIQRLSLLALVVLLAVGHFFSDFE